MSFSELILQIEEQGVQILVCAIFALLSLGWILPRILRSAGEKVAMLTTRFVALAFVSSFLASLFFFLKDDQALKLSIGSLPGLIYFDTLGALFLPLVLGIGLAVAKFSVRYLAAEQCQAFFYKHFMTVIVSVSVLLVSGNFLLFMAGWLTASFGLHQLLLIYPQNVMANVVATKKFYISRLGDVFLITAAMLIYKTFGTFDFGQMFQLATLEEATYSGHINIVWIALFLVLGALTKSAQFPFHTWLPDTLESPTPVSALMHAGIINAGGILVIRMSPVIVLSHTVLDLLAVIGAITAVIGSLVMMTQPTIKRQLAYSTVGQMGFMMLQCGLGAFGAASVHIFGHALYKAHAFLSAGSAVSDGQARFYLPKRMPSLKAGVEVLALGLGFVLTYGMAKVFGFTLTNKPGLLVLFGILSLGAAQWILLTLNHEGLRLGSWIKGLARGSLLVGFYAVLVFVFDKALVATVGQVPTNYGAVDFGAMVAVVTAFVVLFFIQNNISSLSQTPAFQRLYVQAANGFYIGTWLNKWIIAKSIQNSQTEEMKGSVV